MGQLGEVNFVIFFDPSQTPRTFVDVTTIGADKEQAFSSCDDIPEADVKAKSAYVAKEDPLLTLPKLHNERDPVPGKEHQTTGDAHFTKHTLSSHAISLDWITDKNSLNVFQ